MKYAVIEVKGTQYKVEEGHDYLVPLHKENEKVDCRVLLYKNEQKLEIGTPEVKKVAVRLKNLGSVKGDKLFVAKYKAKSRYRKRIGFRAKYTRLRVEKIS